jgi:cytochrome c553
MSRSEHPSSVRARRLLALAGVAVVFTGCIRLDMYNQPKFKPLRGTTFFADGRQSRDFPKGTIARGFLREDKFFYKGLEDTAFAKNFPMPVTREVLLRGQARFNIYCTPCHDWAGTGRGMIVRRGFKQPPSYHIDRLREAPAGYLFDVITNGFATMSGYAAQVPPEDRWAIVAYIRALQLSQNAKLADLPAAERLRVEEALRQAAAAPAAGEGSHSGHESGGH